MGNPVMTLINVAWDGNAAILNHNWGEEEDDSADQGGWRWHAAIVLANLTVEVDVEQLQRALQ